MTDHHDHDDEMRLLALALIDKHHDEDLSKALGRWGESQQVPERILLLSCLRTASYCLAKMIEKDPPADPLDSCTIIEAYSAYFHFYAHIAQDFIKKRDRVKK